MTVNNRNNNKKINYNKLILIGIILFVKLNLTVFVNLWKYFFVIISHLIIGSGIAFVSNILFQDMKNYIFQKVPAAETIYKLLSRHVNEKMDNLYSKDKTNNLLS